MLSKKQIDIERGLKAESDLYETLKQKFDRDIVRTGKYDRFDYQSKNCKIELKDRNNYKNKYSTTMVGLNKVDICLAHPDLDYYFVFNFIDGPYYWKFNKTEYDSFYKGEGGRSDRGFYERSSYLYIPVNRLVKMEK